MYAGRPDPCGSSITGVPSPWRSTGNAIMAKTARRLGRGLNSLVSDLRTGTDDAPTTSPADQIVPSRATSPGAGPRAISNSLPIDAIEANPFQPRSTIAPEDVISLAESIRQSGIIQPIAVRPNGDTYQIIAGERRWLACKTIGLKSVPVIIRAANDEEMLELALVENLHREDLNPIDRASAYRNYCDRFGLKPENVAKRLGEDRTTVINYIRLLDLSVSIRRLLAGGSISMGHARALLGVDDEGRRLELAESVVANSLSVRALEDIVRREKKGKERGETPAVQRRARSAHIQDLERRLEESVATKVIIREGRRKGSGRIVIEYYSLDDFDRISAMLGLREE